MIKETEQPIFENWFTDAYDYTLPGRGEICEGILLEIDENGALIDIGLKHDGIVPRNDLQRLEEETISRLTPGQEVEAQVVRPVDQEGNLILSLFGVRAREDWKKTQEMFENETTWKGIVTGSNRGGLLVQFNHLQGFVPISHIDRQAKHLSTPDDRREFLSQYEGDEIRLRVIEVDPRNNRLIFSERIAEQAYREERTTELLEELQEGQVLKGTVKNLVHFGAFVDIGGAVGMVHISELSWQRIKHPRDVVQVGDEIEVAILKLDKERERINLSLKQLQPDPWMVVQAVYTEGQIVQGEVTNVTQYGAFVLLDSGVEGLVHISEMATPAPDDAREFVTRGEQLVLRILSIEPLRRRIGLSLIRVTEEEREAFMAENNLSYNTHPSESVVPTVEEASESDTRSEDDGIEMSTDLQEV